MNIGQEFILVYGNFNIEYILPMSVESHAYTFWGTRSINFALFALSLS